jgi:short-subunit dehydrogenase
MTDLKIAVITGAAGGIGVAVGRRLALRGYDLVLVERTAELAHKAVADIGTGTPVACDLSRRDDVEALSRRLEDHGSTLHLVVWNAGIIVPGTVVDTSPEMVDLQLDVMLTSVVHLTGAAARVMARNGRGHVLVTVSMGALVALPGSAVYSAAKAGLRAYLTALSAEVRHSGVAVSGIYPSAVR